ncbi:uncharacterized protein LOC128033830 [Gossypium raimondii]|uniref:uncharacterized protein LOC128033830 n=1 Tax=Gossypium raimondii TaxID=29730 RepID=UPI00227D0E22|nr:uncharacterized protein LOC128033830 [Gossypium raimondii]
MHPGDNKMYHDLCELYWWPSLKREVTDFVARCLTCQQVKAEHQLPSGLLQPAKIPLWKWERTNYTLQKLAKLDISEIVRLHGKLHEALGLRLDFSTAFHPQTDSQFEKVRLIRDHLKAAFDRQKSYADLKRRDIEYSMGDFMFLKGFSWKKVLTFGLKGKLSPRFIGSYQILKLVGSDVYQLELPLELDRIHDVSYASMLRRYRSDPSHVVSVEEIEIRSDLTFEEELVQILDHDIKVPRRNSIPLVKVLWWNHGTEKATWEPEDSMRQQYPYLF